MEVIDNLLPLSKKKKSNLKCNKINFSILPLTQLKILLLKIIDLFI